MQTHQRSPSPLKKRSWGQKLIGKITKKSVVDRTSKRKSDRAISEVTLKSGLLESDGYGSAEVSLKQPSENTFEGSISSSQSLNEPKVHINSLLSEPDLNQTSETNHSEAETTQSEEPLTIAQLQEGTPTRKSTSNLLDSTVSPNSECISLQQFLNESQFSSNGMEKSGLRKSGMGKTSPITPPTDSSSPILSQSTTSVRSASSAEIRRISTGANFRNPPTPKERKISSSSSNSDRRGNENAPPTYAQHINRPNYQSPLSSSFQALTTDSIRHQASSGLSQSVSGDRHMTPRRSKIDRLTASKSMFERDRFAESLAALTANRPKSLKREERLFPEPRAIRRTNIDSEENSSVSSEKAQEEFRNLGFV